MSVNLMRGSVADRVFGTLLSQLREHSKRRPVFFLSVRLSEMDIESSQTRVFPYTEVSHSQEDFFKLDEK